MLHDGVSRQDCSGLALFSVAVSPRCVAFCSRFSGFFKCTRPSRHQKKRGLFHAEGCLKANSPLPQGSLNPARFNPCSLNVLFTWICFFSSERLDDAARLGCRALSSPTAPLPTPLAVSGCTASVEISTRLPVEGGEEQWQRVWLCLRETKNVTHIQAGTFYGKLVNAG